MPVLPAGPWRHLPEVELLRRRKINIKEATDKVAKFLADDGARLLSQAENLGTKHVSIKHIPGILEQMQQHWVGRGAGDIPTDCFVEVTGRLEVHLHPRFIGEHLALGLSKHASELLLHYSQVLGCIPLAYSDLRPTGTHAAVVGECPWVHFLVDFKAVGFKPVLGQRLLCTPLSVVKGAESVKGLILQLFGYFRCWVAKDKVPETLRFDSISRGWVDKKGRRVSEEPSAFWFVVEHTEITGEHSINMTGAMQWPAAKQLRPPRTPQIAPAMPPGNKTTTPSAFSWGALAASAVTSSSSTANAPAVEDEGGNAKKKKRKVEEPSNGAADKAKGNKTITPSAFSWGALSAGAGTSSGSTANAPAVEGEGGGAKKKKRKGEEPSNGAADNANGVSAEDASAKKAKKKQLAVAAEAATPVKKEGADDEVKKKRERRSQD